MTNIFVDFSVWIGEFYSIIKKNVHEKFSISWWGLWSCHQIKEYIQRIKKVGFDHFLFLFYLWPFYSFLYLYLLNNHLQIFFYLLLFSDNFRITLYFKSNLGSDITETKMHLILFSLLYIMTRAENFWIGYP